MTFNRYIAVSLFSHALLFAFLSMAPFRSESPFSVFDVKIVPPLLEEKIIPAPPVRPSIAPPSPPVKKAPPIDEKIIPDTLFGDVKATPRNKVVTPQKDLRDNKEEFTVPDTGKNRSGVLPSENGDLHAGEKGPSIVPPSALFDKNTIEEFAAKEPPVDKGLTFDTSEFRHRGYMKMLKEKIESIWQYPREAARLGISGDLFIRFSIKKDGRLGEVELLRTSGYKELDEAAIKALRQAEPFWPLPDDWTKDSLDINGHFIYIYGNTLVM